MDETEFWQSRYESGDLRWDKGAPSPGVEEFLARQPLGGRVLVPGCGSGHDVRAAARRNPGSLILGLDLAPGAAVLAATYDNPPNVSYRTGDFLKLDDALALKNHKLRRETPREAGWDKAGEELREDCMGSYCPNRNSSPTQSRPASRKSQQMACDFSGLVGSFDWMIEHTLFCAIPPARRPDYARSAYRALKPGGHLLAVFYMTPDNDDGTSPPYGCTNSELDALFSPYFELIDDWVPSSFFESRIGKERMRLLRRKPCTTASAP